MDRFKLLFNTTSDLYAIDNVANKTERAISFEKFSTLVLGYGIFNMKGLESFARITNPEGLAWHLEQALLNINSHMRLFRWRLAKVDPELYSETLETLYEKINSGEDPKATWIAFRLMEEESQRIAIEGEMNNYIPALDFPSTLELMIQKHEDALEENNDGESGEEDEKVTAEIFIEQAQ
ncbi:MAG: hypothetical protein V2I33_20375 [Kangiellaceae bacterium]|nr:hypothetical protein [Kangiellaceae bacterium]